MLLRPSKTLYLALGCIPVLYLIHLILLEFYSFILYEPSYSSYASPFRDRYKLPTSNQDSCAMFPPERAPLPTPQSPPPPSHAVPEHPIAQHNGPFTPPTDPERASDIIDSFAHYKHAADCKLSSQDLHIPFSPLCSSKQATLAAISGGGRGGYNKPFIPLDCDMRWYATQELCDIFGRFRAVIFVGDSLMRHIVEASYVFLREDVGLGAIAEWAVEPEPDADVFAVKDCMCGTQTGKRACSDSAIFDSADVPGNATASGASGLACSAASGLRVQFVRSNAYPIIDSEVAELEAAVKATQGSSKPLAVVLHTTFWNNVNLTATTGWIEQVQERLAALVPDPKQRPTMFATANAGGLTKLQKFLGSQNNQAIGNMERDIEGKLAEMGVDMLGCYNMSLQATSSDGTHAAFEGNLLKAMGVFNWLDWAGREASAGL